MKNEEQPIYPVLDLNDDMSGLRGLTKREYFAGLAMQGLLMKFNAPKEKISEWAIEQADELLKQLEK